MEITLRPARARDIPLLDGWFRDAESRRWLGGPGWAKNGLKLTGGERHLPVGEADGTPFGLTDIEIEADNRASFAIIVDPTRRGEHLASGMTEAIVAMLASRSVAELYAGVEDGNLASRRLLEHCGFTLTKPTDADGFTYYSRDLRVCRPPP
ncbi:MAG: GNAT family protein [Devosia sp.]